MKKLGLFGLLLCLLFFRSLPAAVFVVHSTNSQGAGSFRTALNAANALPGRDTIQFAFTGVGPFVIVPDSTTLPINAITDPLLIDGLSQAGTVFPNLQVVVQAMMPWTNTIEVATSDLEVRGIRWLDYLGNAFSKNPGMSGSIRDLYFHHNIFDNSSCLSLYQGFFAQIEIADNILECQSQLLYGFIYGGSTVDSVYVHHNIMQCSSNTNTVMVSLQTDDHATINGIWVEDNQLIGLSAQQYITALNIQIGATGSFADTVQNIFFRRNILTGSASDAVSIQMAPGNHYLLSHVVIDSNVIDQAHTGIQLVHHGTGVNSCEMRDITITRNQISHCMLDGIYILGEMPNGPPMVRDVLIADNEIHDNQTDGISIRSVYLNGAFPQGIYFQDIRLLRNHLTGNGYCGIRLSDSDNFLPDFGPYFQGIAFQENSIHDNNWQGIMANGSYPTATQTCRLPVPQLSHIAPQPPFIIYGTLAAQPNTAYRIEFFANTTPDASGFGEGEFPLGADTILLDAQGNGLIAWPAGASMPLHVSALATNLSNGNSGCFSNTVDTMTVGILERNMAAPSVWPNPLVDEKLYFESPLPIDRLTLYNALGTQIANPTWERAGNGGVVHCGHLAAGVYLLRMESGDGSWTHKLVVE